MTRKTRLCEKLNIYAGPVTHINNRHSSVGRIKPRLRKYTHKQIIKLHHANVTGWNISTEG